MPPGRDYHLPATLHRCRPEILQGYLTWVSNLRLGKLPRKIDVVIGNVDRQRCTGVILQ